MLNLNYDAVTIAHKREQIKIKLFEQSTNIKTDDFTKISDSDLYILYNLYDDIFLSSWFKCNLKGKIKFKLSKQLTRAAGNTTTRKNIAVIEPENVEFVVKISSNHLINFDKAERDKFVGGIKVNSRLDCLMLVFEHEICHVIEFLICKKSSCSKGNFKNLIHDLFGHTESTHKLVSNNEANYHQYGMLVGERVTFEHDGKRLHGFINRINKRATVMSPSKFGKYVDKTGQRYTKYYVPLGCLDKEQG